MHGNNKNNNNWIAVVLVVVAAAVVSLAAAAPLDFTTRPVPDPHCRDLRVNCPERKHECQEHHLWMHSHCPVTCNVCHNRTVETSRQRARFLTATSVDPDTIVDGMGRTVGVPQIISFSSKTNHKKNLTLAAAIVRTVQDSVTYYNKVVMKQERYQSVRALCQNRHERCAEWAVAKDRCNEEAYEDVEYNEYDSATDSHYYYYYSDMIRDCAVTCHRCELLSDEAKCPYTPETMPNAWYPGDVNRMFQRIVTDYSTLYNVTILSKPHDTADPAVATNNDDITDPIRSSIIPEGPWVVTLDNFLTRAECQRLIDLGAAEGYERSSGMVVQANGSLLSDFVTQDRTSRNAWCDSRACRTDPTVRAIHHRMANLTRISSVHYEWMQLLQYKEREFYKTHHDYVPTERNEHQGPRILTIFLYLSDVEQGGGTNFPMLRTNNDDGMTVEPSVGRALLWPSVLDHKPNDLDLRVLHQALPVIRGVKYGANVWVHQRDVQPAACRAAAGLEKTNIY